MRNIYFWLKRFFGFPPDSILSRTIELWIHIGVGSEERKIAQKMILTVTIGFYHLPAMYTDDIGDTISYDDIEIFLKAKLQNRTFFLLEAFAMFCCNVLRQDFLQQFCFLKIMVHKPRFDATFICGDSF